MQVEKQDLEKSAVELVIKIEPAEFEPYEKKAFLKLSSEVKIKGFRAGKIPEKLLKEKVSDDQVFSEALEQALPVFFYQAIEKEKLITIAAPELKIDKFEKNQPLVIRAKVDILPDFKTPNYKTVKVKKEKVAITNKEIEITLKELQNAYAEVRPKLEVSEKGDRAEIDFEGYVNGVKIDSLASKNHPLIIGKGMFVPGFEDKLLGLKTGEEKEFEIMMPKNLREPLAAGKTAKFKVKMNQLQRVILPEVNDEFAKKFSKFKTLNQLKEDIKKSLIKRKEVEIEKKAEIEIVQKIADKVQFEIPETMVKDELGRMINDISADVQSRGLKFEDYLKSLKKSEEEFMKELRPQAEKAVKIALVISKIKEEMRIKVSESEIKKEIDGLKKMGKQVEENEETKRYFKHMIGNRKVVERLMKECLLK